MNSLAYVENFYQGLFLTETILGNPNGSFMENEPRNIQGRVFTTDKCIKYNVRNYLKQKYERLELDEDGQVKLKENFIFFSPRRIDGAKRGEASYMTKDSVFDKYFDDFEDLLNRCPDARIFGGTFSFKGGKERAIYGPVQISYGLDLIGADIINPTLGTPFATEDGKQTTQGQDYLVDHAVIGYDITVNPNNEPELMRESDLEMFKEGLVNGTNLRKSTSKKTNSKLLLLAKFKKGNYPNIGDLKTLVEVKSNKVSTENKNKGPLILNFGEVTSVLREYENSIIYIEVYKAPDVKLENMEGIGDLEVSTQTFSKLPQRELNNMNSTN